MILPFYLDKSWTIALKHPGCLFVSWEEFKPIIPMIVTMVIEFEKWLVKYKKIIHWSSSAKPEEKVSLG